MYVILHTSYVIRLRAMSSPTRPAKGIANNKYTMNNLKRVSALVLSMALILGISAPTTALAAAAPDLGVAAEYSVFGNAGITETPAQQSHLWGNAGGNGLGHVSLIASQVDGSIDVGANVPVANAIASAYGDLDNELQTGAIDLATSPTVVPGVYDLGATDFSSTLTLDGDGVYIFRSSSSIAQTAGGTMLLTNGACASNVYWQIPDSMTFAAPGDIEGTIITNTGLISFVSGVSLNGRAWAATQVTMDNNQITEPTCSTPSATSTLHVIKMVVNDDGGIATSSDFVINVSGTNVSTSTFPGSEAGVEVTLDAGVYEVTEVNLPGYLQSSSADCSGIMVAGETKTCTITNDDVAVVAPPSSGGGSSSGQFTPQARAAILASNGQTATNTATTTVVVASAPGEVLGAMTPNLPQTGSSPQGSIPLGILGLAGVIAVAGSLIVSKRKQTA